MGRGSAALAVMARGVASAPALSGAGSTSSALWGDCTGSLVVVPATLFGSPLPVGGVAPSVVSSASAGRASRVRAGSGSASLTAG